MKPDQDTLRLTMPGLNPAKSAGVFEDESQTYGDAPRALTLSQWRHYASSLTWLFRALDPLALLLSAVVVHLLLFGQLDDNRTLRVVVCGSLLFLLFAEYAGIYRARPRRPWAEVFVISQVWLSALLSAFAYSFLFEPRFIEGHGFQLLTGWSGAGLGLLLLCRVIARLTHDCLRAHGWREHRVALLGLSSRGIAAAAQIQRDGSQGLRIVGLFDDRREPRIADPSNLRYLGTIEQAAKRLSQERVHEVWLAFPSRAQERARQAITALQQCPVAIRSIVDACPFNVPEQCFSECAGVPLLDIVASPCEGAPHTAKDVLDRLLALAFLTLISPLMLLIAIGVRLDSPGPVFYRQERVGWNGRRFVLLKFRSMAVDCERQSGPIWAKPNDERATRLGTLLRRTSLDELPQFINVLKGEMSIVGPRPERPYFVDTFKDQLPNYMKKHVLKAGITGWAQVNGWRGQTNLSKRIDHDLYYIQNWSLRLDFKIMAMTVFKGFISKNAR
jgi:putative colanic acid biosysnthesis UDP-glucose lipid carrier transferase